MDRMSGFQNVVSLASLGMRTGPSYDPWGMATGSCAESSIDTLQSCVGMADARLLLPPRHELVEVNLAVAARVKHRLQGGVTRKHKGRLLFRALLKVVCFTHDVRGQGDHEITRGTLKRKAFLIYERSKEVGRRRGGRRAMAFLNSPSLKSLPIPLSTARTSFSSRAPLPSRSTFSHSSFNCFFSSSSLTCNRAGT